MDGEVPKPFEYFDKGMMAQVGRGAAVVELPTGGRMTGLSGLGHLVGRPLGLLNGAEEKARLSSTGVGIYSPTNGASEFC